MNRTKILTTTDFCALCEEAKEGSMLGVRLDDDFADILNPLGPPDDIVTGPQHVRYGPVEIAAQDGKVSMLYAEVPAGLALGVEAITGKPPPTGDTTSVGQAYLVYGEGVDEYGYGSEAGALLSVAVRPARHEVKPDARLEDESGVPGFLRDREAWINLCREVLDGSAFTMRVGDAIGDEDAARLLGTPVEWDGYTGRVGPIEIDMQEGRIVEIVVRVPRAAGVSASDLGIAREPGHNTVTIATGPAELTISATGRVLELCLTKTQDVSLTS